MTPACRPALALGVALMLAPLAHGQDPNAEDLYRAKCMACHMANGNAPIEAMNFADGKWLHGSKPQDLVKVITEGVPGTAMLPFRGQLTLEQITALAEYVRAFDKSLKPAKKTK